jgi:hypothetical protein
VIRVIEYLDRQGGSPFATWISVFEARAASKARVALDRIAQDNHSNDKGVGGDSSNIASTMVRASASTLDATVTNL